MNKLWFVLAEHPKYRDPVQALYTAPDERAAENLAIESLGYPWEAKRVEFVCETPDEVDMEV